jgi:hypothetical protein
MDLDFCKLNPGLRRYIITPLGVYMTRDIINQVREMLDRHLNVVEIASKLNLDLETVRTAADIIKELIT